MFNFVTMGNDCPDILEFNFRRLAQLYPHSIVYLYDWGHQPSVLARLKQIFPQLHIIPWDRARPGTYMLEKVACIEDCFRRHHDAPLMYFDSDVIIMDRVDEILQDSWDIAATWRPESTYRKEEFGEGTWLNAGVLFINNHRTANSQLFLTEWLRRCNLWENKGWWLDQVELIRLFAEADVDFSQQPDQSGTISIDDSLVACKTLHHTIYNFLPEVYSHYPGYDPEQAKVFHLKSNWRKVKFRLLPGWLKLRWIQSIRNNKTVPRLVNLKLNVLLRYILALGKRLPDKS